jgi:hypothetical protein
VSLKFGLSAGEMAKRWPHIARFLNDMGVAYGYLSYSSIEENLSPAERAAALEEWAEHFEYQLARRAEELDRNPVKRHLVEMWTDSMVYLSQRRASYARGEDPGSWIPQWERRPDLDAAQRAILEEIIADLDTEDGQLVGASRE